MQCCTSIKDNDYVHLVGKGIEKSWNSIVQITKSDGLIGNSVNVVAMNYFIWEVQSADRAETYSLLAPYLSSKLDLITIQLGENVQDTATLEDDYEELIRYVQKKCPNARILVIGQFWTDKVKDNAKKQACESCIVDFIDLSEIQDLSEYQAGIGTIVYDDENNEHIIKHKGVAKHPGNKGMEWIAKKILKILE